MFNETGHLSWRLGRVYFLAFLNPSRRQPDPSPYRQVGQSAAVDEPTTELDRFTAHAADRVRTIPLSPCLTPRVAVVS
jgi:hypothetical protein